MTLLGGGGKKVYGTGRKGGELRVLAGGSEKLRLLEVVEVPAGDARKVYGTGEGEGGCVRKELEAALGSWDW